MITSETKKIVREYFESVPIKGVCDICGNDILPVDKSDSRYPPAYRYNEDKEFYDYYRITTHHYDWGNDSCESYKCHDACCLDCAMKFIKEYWKRATKNSIWPTNELEIKHEFKLTEHDD